MPKTYVYQVLYKGKVIDEITYKNLEEEYEDTIRDDVYTEALNNFEVISVSSNDN